MHADARDHAKYLTLIDAIAYLQQHQRPVKIASIGDALIEYVEVTLDDIALANRLAHDVLGRSLDALPPQTRRLLGVVVAYVAECARTQGVDREHIRFTRRELREATHGGDTQLKLHLARLQEQEYLIAHRHGTQFRYELTFDGDAVDAGRQFVGLIDVDALRIATTPHRSGLEDDRSGVGRPLVGGRSGTGRSEEMHRNASADAGSSSLVAAVEASALTGSRETIPRRSRNGAATAVA